MKDEFIACPYCKTGQKEPNNEMCKKCYDEAMQKMQCNDVICHAKNCKNCKIIISKENKEFPDGSCQKCGEPLNNAEGDFCFECKVGKANV